MDENRKKLYDQLSQNWNVGTWEEFDRDLDDENNQQVAWNAVGGQDGYGDFDLFKQSIQRSPQQEVVNQPVPQWEQQPTMQTDTPQETTTTTEVTPTVEAVETKVEEKPKVDEPKVEVTDTEQEQPTTTEVAPSVDVTSVEQTAPKVDYTAMSDADAAKSIDSIEDEQTRSDAALEYSNQRLQKSKSEIANKRSQSVSISQDDATRLGDRYAKLFQPYSDADGNETTVAQQAIIKHYDRYNDNIVSARSWSDDKLRDEYVKVMKSNTYRSDEERAADVIPIIEEMNARQNGGHALTMGEREAEDYLSKHPELRTNYEKWRNSEDGFNSHKTDEATPFVLSDMVMQEIETNIKKADAADKRRRPNSMFTDPITDRSFDVERGLEMVQAMNVSEALRNVKRIYGSDNYESYVVAFAARHNMSVEAARQRVDELVYLTVGERMMDKLEPTSSTEYFLRKALYDNFIVNIGKGLLNLATSKPGDVTVFSLDDQAMQRFEQRQRGFAGQAVVVGATLSSFAVDMLSGGFTLPAAAGRVAGGAMARVLGKDAAQVFWKRLATGATSGAFNFAVFESQCELLRQMRTGDYSGENISKSFFEGLMKGAAFGTVGESIGRLFWNSRGWMVPVGEAVKLVGEAATFSTIGYLETGSLTAKDWATNFGMALSGRLHHASEYIADVKSRMKNGKVHKIDANERAALAKKGYGNIADVLHNGKLNKSQLDALESELESMRNDKSVSWETIRLAEFALNGRLLPAPPMTDFKAERDADGNWVFTPWDKAGDRAIGGSVTVKGTEARNKLQAELSHQCEKNAFILNEAASGRASMQRAIGKAVISWCDETPGYSASSVYKLYTDAVEKLNSGEKLGDFEKEVFDGVNKKMKGVEAPDDVADYKKAMRDEGYDLDKILAKPSSKRTTQERAALDRYKTWLDSREADVRNANESDFYGWMERNAIQVGHDDAKVVDEVKDETDEKEESQPEEDNNLPKETEATEDVIEPETEQVEVEETKVETEPEVNTEKVVEPTEPEEPEPPTETPPTAPEGEPTGEGESISEPLDVGNNELPIKEAPENLAGGKAADTHDIKQLWPKDFDGITEDGLDTYLEVAEQSRKQAHDYAEGNGEKPDELLWQYWAERDGLKEPEASVETPTTEAPVEAPVEQEPTAEDVDVVEQVETPEKRGLFGNIYNQFKGKAQAAIYFLLGRGEGLAKGALHHDEVGDIDIWYGNDNAGLKKIAEKHPEVIDDLQGVIDGMRIVKASENRIILESDTHRAIISKMLGNEKTDNWLLSAYEKKDASGGSSDIVPEPVEGKQNGTAPLQDTPSGDKGNENISNDQINDEKNAEIPQQPVEPIGSEPVDDTLPMDDFVDKNSPEYFPEENKGGGRMSPDWERATTEQIVNRLLDREKTPQPYTVIAERTQVVRNKLKKIESEKPKGRIDTSSKERKMRDWQNRYDKAKKELQKWYDVKQAFDKAFGERARAEAQANDADITKSRDRNKLINFLGDKDYHGLYDFVLRALGAGDTKFRWRSKGEKEAGGRVKGSTMGLGGHLGLTDSNKERQLRMGLIDDKNGVWPEEYAEQLYESMDSGMQQQHDAMEVFDTMLDVLRKYNNRVSMLQDAVAAHLEDNIDPVQREMEEYEKAEQEQYEKDRRTEAAVARRESETLPKGISAAVDGALADRIADARSRLSNPNSSEFEKQAARKVLEMYGEQPAKYEQNSEEPNTSSVVEDRGDSEGYRSLFEDMNDEQGSVPKESPRVQSLREEITKMGDEDLLKNIGEATPDDKTFYSEEYDKRHMQEYNEACDNYRRMLDEGQIDEKQAEEMLLDAIHDWRDGFSSAERTRLRAQFDTLNDYYAEKEGERIDREMAEEDARIESEEKELEVTAPAFDPTTISFRPLEGGETSFVERKYERSGQFDFTGSERVESADDIAYIFRNLENSSIENVFLVLIKDGRPTILHVGMGSYDMSLGHIGAGMLAASELRPDRVVMVHNHPSGTLEPSVADKKLHEKVVRMFGEGVVESSIIIDTTRGEYSTFDANYDYGVSPMKESSDGEIPYETYTFSRYAFSPDFNPTKAFLVRSSEDVATFVSSHRLGERKKVSLIVLDRQKRVVGNVFLPWTKMENADIKDVVSEVSRYTHQMGGESCVLYGRIDVEKSVAKEIKEGLKDKETYLLDFVDVERGSYNDHGVMEEGISYGGRQERLEDAQRRLDDPNASEFEKTAARTVLRAYGGGDTPDGGNTVEDSGVRYRIKDDAERMTGEVVYKNRQARQRKEAVADFVKATADLDEMTDSKFATALNKVMRGQREYDKDTVKDITDMAKAMMDAGLLSGLDDFAVRQILTKVKDATGKDGVTKEANKLIDIMLKHQLKKGKSEFEQSLKAKGMKQDSRGVVVQGGLDYHGQRMVKALKEALGLSDLQAVNDRIDEVEQKLNDPDEVVRGNAKDELDGLYIARQYFDEIKQNEINEALVKKQLEDAKEQHKNGTMADDAYKQFKQACEDSLRELRCERVDAWHRLNESFGDSKSEAAERAKAFREEQNQRKEEIQHWANSDLEGVDGDPHAQSRKTRGQRKMDRVKHGLQLLTNPLATFDKLMRFFGEKFPKGEGNLFNFVRKAVDSRDSFFKNRKQLYDQMDDAVYYISAGHDMKMDSWRDIYTYVKKLPTLKVNVRGEEYPISQGQAVYLLAMEAQTDGRMKLRAMGITEADMDALRDKVDPMLLELQQWVVDELLPGMRKDLNQTHLRMFGADMSDIANYFPIRTNELARNETVNLAQQNGKIRPATITGSIIERKRNTADIDITQDFFQVAAEHVSEMSHWNSFAELSRDLNTLLSYKNFRAKVNNMSSLRYGDGKQIWDALQKCCAITTGDYIAEVGSGEKIVNAATRKMAQANIALRVYTAAKQLLSAPVYLVQARWDDIIKNIANPMGTWKWAIENLPTFAERWQGRVAGDPILTESDKESSAAGYKYNKVKQGLAKAGYFTNAAVDAMTVAIGGRSIYETKLRQYKEMGYSEEEANKKALQDAAISVNETQQSGIGTFLSPIQQDRTFWSRMVTLYRNASMGFQRELVGGLTAIKNGLSETWREEAIRKASTKMIREGVDADVAQRVAERMANREAIRGVAWAAMFGSIAPAVWALGGQYFPYKLSGGDDNEEENEGLLHAAVHLFSGWAEGLVFGQTLGSAAEFGIDYVRGKKKFRDFGIDMDLFSESFEQIGQKMDGKRVEAIYDLARMFVAMGVGVDPKTIVDPIVGIMDFFGNDYGSARDFGLLFMRIMNVPQSAVDQTYIDELQMTAGEAQKLPAEELAQRWATYKRRKGAGPLNAFTSEEYDKEIEDKYVKRFEKLMDARLDLYDGARLDEAMQTADPFVKKHLVKKVTTDSGLEYRAPRNEQGRVYEQFGTKEDMDLSNQFKQRFESLDSIADGYRKLGGKRDGKKWVRDTSKKGTDKEARKAYKEAHKDELDKAATIAIAKGKIDKKKAELLNPGADQEAIMQEIRKLQKEALDKTQ